ncbi:MAG: hypothetical protein DRJ33_08640 [Candidatus Methanomethylicota archaeon]|uniref:Uncharacterized protein n=1 Tax=Thermoproteota archaeon TaxID=2056631 RepID=A0A497EP21_9CREN|nr:MAG: hypothetical protein DRJ33_08640 [Candidatus Verstraetearchaeota archaeon]
MNKKISSQFLEKEQDWIAELYFNDKHALLNLLKLADYNGTTPIDKNLAYLLLQQVMRSSFSDEYALVGRSSLYALDVLERLNVESLKHLESVYAIGNYSIASFSYPYNGSNLALLVKASEKNRK